MDAIIAHITNAHIHGVFSVITLVEVLPVPLSTGNARLVGEYRDILLNSHEFVCLPVNQTTAEVAADLRARYTLRTPDALHLATAITAGCDGFLTNDVRLKRVTDIVVLVLDELELHSPS